MRDIEYRGKLKHNSPDRDGRWIYGFYVITSCKAHLMYQHNDIAKFIYPETVGEFTGLLDKNGVKIFEGDIVRIKNLDGQLTHYAIRYDVGNGRFIGDNPGEIYDLSAGMFSETKVIGNVHDNPELLEARDG